MSTTAHGDQGDSAENSTAVKETVSSRILVLKELVSALLHEVEGIEAESESGGRGPDLQSGINFHDEVRRFESALIRQALWMTRGHQRRASRLLRIKPTTLNAKIKRYDIRL